MTSPSDVELIARLAQRDQAALTALYERYANLVYSLALRVVQDGRLAEEVTQDVFMEVWNRPERWDVQKGRFSSWLLTVTRYTAIDRLRGERGRTEEMPYEDTLSHHPDDDPLSAWAEAESLRPLLARLPPEQRYIIDLAFFQGLTHSQIAEKTGLPLGTVKTRLRTALTRLREQWEDRGE
jgi:RNA polymerase sigma-70 factor (ECF subfamily)